MRKHRYFFTHIKCKFTSRNEFLSIKSFQKPTCVYYCLNLHHLLLRILEEQAIREYALALFRLPRAEKLHEVAHCSIWTPHARCHTSGTLYTTDGYLCFSSREEGNCTLLLPLSEVLYLHPAASLGSPGQQERKYTSVSAAPLCD